MRRISLTAMLLAMVCACVPALALPCGGPDQPAVYFLSLKDIAAHKIHVSICFGQGEGPVEFQLPVWNALYQVRDFSQYLQDFRPSQPNTVPPTQLEKVGTSLWRVTAPHIGNTVSFEYMADSPGPFGIQASSEHVFINWAQILPYRVDQRERPISVGITDIPTGWHLRDGGMFCKAECDVKVEGVTYDQLVDCPLEIGTFAETRYTQNGATYHIAIHGDPADYDMEKVSEEVQKITAAEIDWMQDRPFDSYTFLYHFPRGPAGGGMEHAYSTAIDSNVLRMKSDPLGFESVTAHEFFHLWNVKRIRPRTLEPVDFAHEQPTRALWFSEGCTSTVADYMLVRAGLLDEAGFLKRLAGQIQELQSRPAHQQQSAEQSSVETWFDKYPFYRSPERSISYYNKGQIIGVLLDLRMRELTGGRRSLRDLFHYMNQRWAKQGQYFDDSNSVRLAAEVLTGDDFKDFFAKYVAGVAEIPYDEFFKSVGLHLVKAEKVVASLGFNVSRGQGTATVTSVDPNTDAAAQGLASGDVILSINDKPYGTTDVPALLRSAKPGDVVHLVAHFDGADHTFALKLASKTVTQYALQDLPDVTPAQNERRAAWIRGDSQAGGAR